MTADAAESGIFAYEADMRRRFDKSRRTWSSNSQLRSLYSYWYGEIRSALTPVQPGVVIEIGSGASFSKEFLPGIRTSDIAHHIDHDYQIDATRPWPFRDGSLDAVVLFDVLHHLASPRVLFREAGRTLRPGGRLLMMEPYVSLLSYPVYRFFHVEGLNMSVEPLSREGPLDKDPFEGNQAVPGLIFGRYRSQFQREFPMLRLIEQRLYSGISYVASGGYSRPPFVPMRVWNALFKLDRAVPGSLRRVVGFRMLLVLERVAALS
jgi:SAM-dependent methyltransferase